MNNATIGAAVLSGYLLGRTKKAKVALGLGALLAGSRVKPGQLGKAIDSPFIGDITRQVRTELTEASKAAATSVLTAKADSLAGTLHERTVGLRERVEGTGEQDRAEDEDEEKEPAEEDAEDETAEDDETTEEDETAEEDEAEAEEDEKAGEGRKGRVTKAGGGTSARRSGGRSTAQRSGSTARKSEPRPKKKTAAASRAKSGTGTRSRRQDDG